MTTQHHINREFAVLLDEKLNEITRPVMLTWVEKRRADGYKPSTNNRSIGALGAVFTQRAALELALRTAEGFQPEAEGEHEVISVILRFAQGRDPMPPLDGETALTMLYDSSQPTSDEPKSEHKMPRVRATRRSGSKANGLSH